MIRLNLSICGSLNQDTSVLNKLLKEFQDLIPMQTQVETHSTPWESYRQELTTMALYNREWDVSQSGTPVASDLVAMNAIRAFTHHEVEEMGGKDAFLPVAWQSIQQISDDQVWAIPWLADPRIFLYWRDIFEQAGADEKTVFQSPENLIASLGRIQAGGIAKPWGITTGHKHSAIHTVTSWIWASGGDFISKDGKNALFLEPEAMAGLKAYFSLINFMAPECQTADYQLNNQLFVKRQSAIILGNAETATNIIKNIPAKMRSQLAVALPFGVPLVGGSCLIVWSSSLHEEAAVKLVEFLTGRTFQKEFPISLDHLPVRLDVVNEPPYTTDPILKGFSEALHKGRIFPINK